MAAEEYLISELAERAHTTPRTIRYYTIEGLLPQPTLRGKYAYYNQEHLDRLTLIFQLKDAYLPLKEIRQTLLSLSWPEVQDMLTKSPPPALNNEGPSDRGQIFLSNNRTIRDSAAEYIERILKNQAEARSPQNKPRPPMPAMRDIIYPTEVPPPSQATPPESWRRITLAPGVELHLREPYASAEKDKIDQLIQIARQLFQNPRK